MNKAVPVNLAERCCEANSDAQAASQLERLAFAPIKDLVERLAAWVFEYEHRPRCLTSERARPGCPRGIEVGGERIFVLEPSQALRTQLFCGERDGEHR
jgi:hypothetical protein